MMLLAVCWVCSFKRCQISYVIKGMMGCRRRRRVSRVVMRVVRVLLLLVGCMWHEGGPADKPWDDGSDDGANNGFVSSKYQSQKTFQVNSYKHCANKSKR